MLNFLKKKLFPQPPPTLEAQLATLKACGIAPATPEIGTAVLTTVAAKHARHPPYLALLLELGSDAAPDANFSNNVWHFDTECIEDHGDYVAIARRLASLSQGALTLSDLQDHVDIENDLAWLSFRIGDQLIRWELAIDDDWVDPAVFDRFAALLAQSGSERRFVFIDLQGQDCLVACMTTAEKDNLERATDLKMEWFGTR
jgi:hypothetical protein